MQKQVWRQISGHWRKGLLWGVVLVLVSLTLSYRIGTLFPGASTEEINYFSSVSSGKEVIKNPVYLPHKLPSYMVVKLVNSLSGVRMVSVLFSTVFLVGAWYILRQIFSKRTAVMGLFLLLFSSWFLIIARSAVGHSSYLLAVAFAAGIVWILKNIDSWKVVPTVIALSLPFLYVPGLLYVVFGATIYWRSQINAAIRALTPKQRLLSGGVAFVLVLPLIISIVLGPSIIVRLLGVPLDSESYTSFATVLLDNLKSLLYRSQASNPYTLVSLPYLDIFTAVLFFIGMYRIRYWTGPAQIKAGLVIAASLAITSLSIVPLNALLPLIYAMVIYGVSFLLAQWYTVFPKNPVARGIGASLLLVSVLLIGYFHTMKFFVAWPNTPQTEDNYSQTLIK